MTRKDFIRSCVILCIFMLPLGIWGDSYIDDISRSTSGGYGWSTNARPISDLIFYVINFGGLNPASYPLPLLMAILIMSACSCIIKESLLKGFGTISSFVCCAIFISPLYLGNTSFNYDILPMSASVLFASFILIDLKSTANQIVKSFLVTILTLCTYQASLNVIIALSSTLALIGVVERRDRHITGYICNISGSLVGVLFYLKIISPFFISGHYSQEKSKVIDILNADAFIFISENFKALSFTLKASTTPVISLTVALSAFASVVLIYYSIIKNNRNDSKLPSFLFAAICFSILFLSSLGPFILMKSYANTPRALIGISSFSMCIIIIAYKLIGEKNKAHFLFVPALLSSLMISHTYAQSVKVQRLYERAVASRIISDVDNLSDDRHSGYVIIGTVGSPLQVKIAEKKFPIISILLQPLISDNGMWSNGGMMNYGMQRRMAGEKDYIKVKRNTCSSKIIKSGNYYDLLKYEDIPVIDFTRQCTAQ